MPRQRQTRRIYPAAPGEDMTIVRWLIREGFDRSFNRDSLRLVNYREKHVPAVEGIAAAVADGNSTTAMAAAAGRPLEEFDWWIFTADGETDDDLISYLSAESDWHRDRYTAWLDAEKKAARRAP